MTLRDRFDGAAPLPLVGRTMPRPDLRPAAGKARSAGDVRPEHLGPTSILSVCGMIRLSDIPDVTVDPAGPPGFEIIATSHDTRTL